MQPVAKALSDVHVAVIGLGYVGLPLAVEFGKRYPTVGFDINSRRIAELEQETDRTLEVSTAELQQSKQLRFSDELESGGSRPLLDRQ